MPRPLDDLKNIFARLVFRGIGQILAVPLFQGLDLTAGNDFSFLRIAVHRIIHIPGRRAVHAFLSGIAHAGRDLLAVPFTTVAVIKGERAFIPIVICLSRLKYEYEQGCQNHQ